MTPIARLSALADQIEDEAIRTELQNIVQQLTSEGTAVMNMIEEVERVLYG